MSEFKAWAIKWVGGLPEKTHLMDSVGSYHQEIPEQRYMDATDASPCWCCPREIDSIIVHRSPDGREFYERRERKLT